MRPYYDDGTCTIYHADVAELAVPAKADLVIADPPYGAQTSYGVGRPPDYASRGRGLLAAPNDYPAIAGDEEPFDPSLLLTFERVVLWGGQSLR